jgi:hypothetical protein
LPEIDKLAQAFRLITDSAVEHALYEIELARAMKDQETVVKQQIKMETIKHARTILQDCYMLVTRRRAWDE